MITKLHDIIHVAANGELCLAIAAAIGTNCATLFGRTLHYENIIILGLNLYALLRVIEYALKRCIKRSEKGDA